MARLTVWIPDELVETMRQALPELNVSATLQEAIRALLACRHERAVCAACASPLDLFDIAARAVDSFYVDVSDRLEGLVRRSGTAEGAVRILAERAAAHEARSAPQRRPLIRPSRAEREAAKVLDYFRDEAPA